MGRIVTGARSRLTPRRSVLMHVRPPRKPGPAAPTPVATVVTVDTHEHGAAEGRMFVSQPDREVLAQRAEYAHEHQESAVVLVARQTELKALVRDGVRSAKSTTLRDLWKLDELSNRPQRPVPFLANALARSRVDISATSGRAPAR